MGITEDPQFKKAVFLVESEDHKLFLDEQTAKDLRSGIETVIKFTNGKFLDYHEGRRRIHGQFLESCVAGLSDKEETALVWQFDKSTNKLWSSKFPNREGKEFRLNVYREYFEAGTLMYIIHWYKYHPHGEKGSAKENIAEVFVINDDNSISPRDHKSPVFLGERGDLEDADFVHQLGGYDAMRNDEDGGHDTLGGGAIARCLANRIAAIDLVPPFVLGIFGDWGAGKSYFVNLMKQRLIRIQKEKVPKHLLSAQYVGHIYYVHFNAWTYSKQSLWSSLMFKIFNDLNDQLELERLVNVSKEGGISTIELNDCLSRNEMKYVQELLKVDDETRRNIDIDKLKETLNKGTFSEKLSQIFATSANEDKENVKKLIDENKRLELKLKVKAMKEQGSDFKSIIGNIILDMFQSEAALEKMLEDDGEDYCDTMTKEEQEIFLKTQKILEDNSLQEIFDDHFGFVEKFWVYFNYFRQDRLLHIVYLLILVPIFSLVCYLIWKEFGDDLVGVISVLISGTVSVVVAAYRIFQKVRIFIQEKSAIISDEIKIAREAAQHLDIEQAPLRRKGGKEEQDGKKEREEIRRNQAKINAINNRLKVLEGDSIHDIVKGRMASDHYENLLGILHKAHNDLETLSQAMLSKAKDIDVFPRGEPRVVIFFDDMDRCEQEKVVELLEAMQLLVKNKLFVAVVAMDPRYVCKSLEKKYKGVLSSRNPPTGMEFLEKIIQVPYRLPPIIHQRAMRHYVALQITIGGEVLVSDDMQGWRDENYGELQVAESSDRGSSAFWGGAQKFFTPAEGNALEDACVRFRLSPRAAKRIVNVLKLILEIHYSKYKERMKETLLQQSLLLLVMAASNETKFGIQKVFTMMETFRIPQGFESPNKRTLMHVVKANCENLDDFSGIDDLKEHRFKMDDKGDSWKKISDKFLLARSFSFVHYNQESCDEEADLPP
jgi:tRNA A37 threonylcarbamoyladenosine biosynthesis protein TsaE